MNYESLRVRIYSASQTHGEQKALFFLFDHFFVDLTLGENADFIS